MVELEKSGDLPLGWGLQEGHWEGSGYSLEAVGDKACSFDALVDASELPVLAHQ